MGKNDPKMTTEGLCTGNNVLVVCSWQQQCRSGGGGGDQWKVGGWLWSLGRPSYVTTGRFERSSKPQPKHLSRKITNASQTKVIEFVGRAVESRFSFVYHAFGEKVTNTVICVITAPLLI